MRTHTRIVLLSVLLFSPLLCSASLAQEEQWLQYYSSADARQIIPGMTYQFKEPSSSKPAGIKLPEFVADQPLFILWETPLAKSGKVWIAFDRTSKQGQYDKLYIDGNVNGDLSDDPALSPSRRESPYVTFAPVKVVFAGEDGPITYHLSLQFYWSTDRSYCLLMPACWYEGPVTVGGVKKNCLLLDYNTNGAFNDTSADGSKSDRIRIGPVDSQDLRWVGKYIEVDDKLYRTQIAQDGACITLSEASDVPYATVKTAVNISRFAAGGENGLFTREPKDGVAKLPVGSYRTDHWAMARKDDKGSKWELVGRYSSSRGSFTVAQDQETELPYGEPVYSTLEVRQAGSAYSFGHKLEGGQSESIELLRNGARPQAPRLRIRTRDGTYDRALNFEYG